MNIENFLDDAHRFFKRRIQEYGSQGYKHRQKSNNDERDQKRLFFCHSYSSNKKPNVR